MAWKEEAPEVTAGREASILTQVAFKGAVEFAQANPQGDVLGAFETYFSHLTESLFSAVKDQQLSALAALPQRTSASRTAPRSNQDAVGDLKREFPGTTEESNLRVVGEQDGPLPEWLVDPDGDPKNSAVAAGVSDVFDNRPAEGNRPWFKEAVDVRGMTDAQKKEARFGAKAFWPPKEDAA